MSDEKDSSQGLVAYWMRKIKREEKAREDFRKAAKAAEAAYFDEDEQGRKNLFPIFWSNVNTLHSALYQQPPKADVRPRYSFEGPQQAMAKLAAQAVERGIEYTLDTTDFDESAHRLIDDFLIAGLGVPWIEYDAQVQRDEAGEPVAIALQRVRLKHIPWSCFHWEPGKDWADVDWVAKDDYLTASELKSQFGVEPGGEGKRQREGKSAADKYASTFRVCTIYYRPRRTIYVICEDIDQPLEIRKDALNLQGFYPCTLPLMSNVRSGDLQPKPDYAFYENQCAYINRLTGRIENITKQLKVAGFYDAALAELAQLETAPDGTLFPVADLLARLQSTNGAASFDRVVAQLPINDKAAVLAQLYQLRDRAKADIYEITGISDIVRGVTVASETASAQQIKGQWAQVRIARRKQQVNAAMREAFRIMAEIMCEHFTPETWAMVTGLQLPPPVLALIKQDVSRTLLIDVETDSTIAADDQEEKAQRLEMLQAVTPYLQNVLPMMQQGILPADLGNALLRTAFAGFKHGKELEDVLAALPGTQQQMGQMQQQAQQATAQVQQLQQQLAQLQQALAAAQAPEQQAKMAKAAADVQGAQADVARTAADIQLVQAKTAATVAGVQARALGLR